MGTKWHPNNKKTPPQVVAEIIAMVKNDMTAQQIADHRGETVRYIQNVINFETDGIRAIKRQRNVERV